MPLLQKESKGMSSVRSGKIPGMSTRIPRKLDAVEVRVLGSLLEKEQTNPETVPMTVNALIAACNQKTNREPVMQLTEDQVVTALDWMRQEVLAWRSEGARTERWQQSVSRRWGLDRAGKALITLLLLRGPQRFEHLLHVAVDLHAGRNRGHGTRRIALADAVIFRPDHRPRLQICLPVLSHRRPAG